MPPSPSCFFSPSSLAAGVVAWHVWSALLLSTLRLISADHVDDASIPDVRACCRLRGVSEFCVDKLCNIREPPNEFDVFEVTSDCPQSLKDVAECLADGRDHSNCCKSKSRGVEDSCLHLCAGTPTKLNVTQWDDYKAYVACLSFNVQSMYNCMVKGYGDIPGPPRNVVASVSGSTAAMVSWNPPEKLSAKVRRYFVFYSDKDQGAFNKEITTSTLVELKNLAPDTKYVVYVVASGGEEDMSIKSEPKYFTTGGVSPEVEPYEAEVYSPLDVSKTLICKIFGRRRPPTVVWRRKRDSDSSFSNMPESGNYNQTIYQTPTDKGDSNLRIYVSSLILRKVSSSDFGIYRCIAKNTYGEGYADIRLRKLNSLRIPTAPPNVTECCIREGVQPLCMSACRNDVQTPANASLFESVLFCAADIPKVTHCALEQKNYGACCLRQQVPFRCLPICDGSLRPSLATKINCAIYNTAIFSCLWEEKSGIPFPPSDMKLKSSPQNGRATVEWSAVPTAEVYHVYYRRVSESNWQRVTVSNTAAVLTNLISNNAYFVQILSANAAGTSDGSRVLKFQTNNYSHKDQPFRAKRRNGGRAHLTSST